MRGIACGRAARARLLASIAERGIEDQQPQAHEVAGDLVGQELPHAALETERIAGSARVRFLVRWVLIVQSVIGRY